MKFAIRDDDTCYFTNPEDLNTAYDFIHGNRTISLSVTPFAVPFHKKLSPFGNYEMKEYPIGNNNELINYLKHNIENDRYDIMLHGYSHEYHQEESIWKAEMIWKKEDRLAREIKEGKHYLEKLMNIPISVFVAPNNMINAKGIKVLEDNNLNLSGIIRFNDRKLSYKYFCNFVRRWSTRVFQDLEYGGVLDYGRHKELNAYVCDSMESLVRKYNYCKKNRMPFVIYTHYWALNKYPEKKEIVKQIYEYAIDDGAELVSLSSLF